MMKIAIEHHPTQIRSITAEQERRDGGATSVNVSASGTRCIMVAVEMGESPNREIIELTRNEALAFAAAISELAMTLDYVEPTKK